jgi:hypothetical protein
MKTIIREPAFDDSWAPLLEAYGGALPFAEALTRSLKARYIGLGRRVVISPTTVYRWTRLHASVSCAVAHEIKEAARAKRVPAPMLNVRSKAGAS